MPLGQDLLDGPAPTFIPEDSGATQALADGQSAQQVAANFPATSLPWAVLADEAWNEQRVIESYAYARTGYHRGLDALRRNGWKGHGPVPWSHLPNQGFLRCLNALGRAAGAINEVEEADRCEQFLADCDPQAVIALTR